LYLKIFLAAKKQEALKAVLTPKALENMPNLEKEKEKENSESTSTAPGFYIALSCVA